MTIGEMFEPVIDHFAARHRVIIPMAQITRPTLVIADLE
jgi:hypothetical protein